MLFSKFCRLLLFSELRLLTGTSISSSFQFMAFATYSYSLPRHFLMTIKERLRIRAKTHKEDINQPISRLKTITGSSSTSPKFVFSIFLAPMKGAMPIPSRPAKSITLTKRSSICSEFAQYFMAAAKVIGEFTATTNKSLQLTHSA